MVDLDEMSTNAPTKPWLPVHMQQVQRNDLSRPPIGEPAQYGHIVI
jgi:hypothetical protein